MTNNVAQARRALVIAALVFPVFTHGARVLDGVVFQANWLIQGENAYMVAGRDKGFYREEGIDLDIKRGFGSGDTVKKVVGGAATVGTADMGVVMLAMVREQLPIKCISAEYSYSPQGFWVLASSDVKSIKDLAGKRAGVTPGNSLLVYFPLVAEANDLDPSKLTFVTMEASALLPTLLAGQIDAMPGFATVFDLRNEETSAQGKPLRSLPFAKHGLKVYGECQFVAEASIKGKSGSHYALHARHAAFVAMGLGQPRRNRASPVRHLSGAERVERSREPQGVHGLCVQRNEREDRSRRFRHGPGAAHI
jgi:hypothetical protein